MKEELIQKGMDKISLKNFYDNSDVYLDKILEEFWLDPAEIEIHVLERHV